MCILISAALLVYALVESTAIASADAPTCPRVEAPPASICVATAQGLVYADTLADASAATRAIREAAQRFAAHFDRAPTGVVVVSATMEHERAHTFARTHGLEYAFVWLPEEAKHTMAERAARRAGFRRSDARALARSMDVNGNVLRHELGHFMYAALYWPDAAPSPEGRYGTPAPDWIDEAAAILMETPRDQADRLAYFTAKVGRRPGTATDLARFLASEHPSRTAAESRRWRRGETSDSGIEISMTSAASSDKDDFYGLSMLVALFLADTSGNPRILAPISTSLASGKTFEQWLASEGPAHGLPDALPTLEQAWVAWLETVIRTPRRSSR